MAKMKSAREPVGAMEVLNGSRNLPSVFRADKRAVSSKGMNIERFFQKISSSFFHQSKGETTIIIRKKEVRMERRGNRSHKSVLLQERRFMNFLKE